jgi:hypothetical protein
MAMEKAQLPSPAEHPSFQRHRRELRTKIIAPILVAVVVIAAVATLTSVAAFGENSEVGRWAAISTIWIVIPFMAAGFVFLLIFAGLIYGMSRLLQVIPPYTGYAQKFVWRIQGYIKRAADMVVQPVLSLDGIMAMLKQLFGIK